LGVGVSDQLSAVSAKMGNNILGGHGVSGAKLCQIMRSELANSLIAQDFYWPLIRQAISVTIHSTFSTSVPAIVRDIAVVGYLLIRIGRRDGGFRAVLKHFRENFAEAFTVVAIAYVFGFGWNVYMEIKEVNNRAVRQPTPSVPSVAPPPWALDMPPDIGVSLKAIDGFTFMAGLPPGEYDLKQKREYELTISNAGSPAQSLNFEIQPPLPWVIVASNIVLSRGVRGARFEPRDQPRAFGNGSIGIGGCFADFSYRFMADSIASKGLTRILLVMEKSEKTKQIPASENGSSHSFVFGNFKYEYRGNAVRGRYYAPLVLDGDIAKLSKPIEERSAMTIQWGFVLTPPPCIPASSLR
jgi:hypothetical protein